MKIGILTFFRMNYGAILQAYALQAVLESLGHTAELINYSSNPHCTESLFDSWVSAKGVVFNFFTVLRFPSFVARKQRISNFHHNNLHISRKQYFIKRRTRKKSTRI